MTLSLPREFSEQPVPPNSATVEMARFSPGEGHTRQVIVTVGCAPATVDELVTAAVNQPREGLEVTEVADVRGIDIEGLDSARLTLQVLGAGRADDADTARIAGLYGVADDVLVLVEYSSATAAFSRSAAEDVLDSVRIDRRALLDNC